MAKPPPAELTGASTPPLALPLCLCIPARQILFGAMFAFADNAYNGPVATAAHALMGATLTQVGGRAGALRGACAGLSLAE